VKIRTWIEAVGVFLLTSLSLFLFLSALALASADSGSLADPHRSLDGLMTMVGAVSADGIATWLVWRRLAGRRRQALGVGVGAATLAGATIVFQPLEPAFALALYYVTVVWLFATFSLAAVLTFEAASLVRRHSDSEAGSRAR
jgi:hypothetical protein